MLEPMEKARLMARAENRLRLKAIQEIAQPGGIRVELVNKLLLAVRELASRQLSIVFNELIVKPNKKSV